VTDTILQDITETIEVLRDRVWALEEAIAGNNGAHRPKSQNTCPSMSDQEKDIEGIGDGVHSFKEEASKPYKKRECIIVPLRPAENLIPDRTTSAGR